MANNTNRKDILETQMLELSQSQSIFQSVVQKQFEDFNVRMEGFTQSIEDIIAKKLGEAIKEITTMAGKENVNPNVATPSATHTRGERKQASFISGLKEEIRQMLELLQPKTLIDAMQLARKQEVRVGDAGKTHKSSKFSSYTNPGMWRDGSSDGV
ncbi:hypothetical protein DH2020_015335 [Rehmannia glutinosa]|uniref:Uncharacterized protein n=1 Tax=Rehmannia glutinosa TaxID=99300 RepID=A0ABR0WSA7_REHGL